MEAVSPVIPHGVTTQNTVIFTAVRTSDLTFEQVTNITKTVFEGRTLGLNTGM
jgi:hypothetical protein